MKTLHRYVLDLSLKNILLSLTALTALFVLVDFFDRIDNIIVEDASIGTIFAYFFFKTPLMITTVLPLATLIGTMLTFGILSKNSELTAMRASGSTQLWIARPVLLLSLGLSLAALILNETVVPYATRRQKEIYNIDIKKKDQRGGYSQSNFWWRADRQFYSVNVFDSRTSTLFNLSRLELNQDFTVDERLLATKAIHVSPTFGWKMEGVENFSFEPDKDKNLTQVAVQEYRQLPLPIKETPQDFFDVETEPYAMSYRQLRRFIKQQVNNGIPAMGYKTELRAKLAFPFVCFIGTLVVLPFCMRPARSGGRAVNFLAGLIIAFTYYVVHSFSMALGHAEFWPPTLAAWMANLVMGFIGVVLNLGAEAP